MNMRGENSSFEEIGGIQYALQYWQVYMVYIVLCSIGAIFGLIGKFLKKTN